MVTALILTLLLQANVEPPSCIPGRELVVGILSAAEHEAQDGWYSVGQHFALHVQPGSIPNDQLMALRGHEVIVLIRERRPRHEACSGHRNGAVAVFGLRKAPGEVSLQGAGQGR